MMWTDCLLHHFAGLDSTPLAPPKFGSGSTDTRQAESLRLLTLSARGVKGIVYVSVKLCDYHCCSFCVYLLLISSVLHWVFEQKFTLSWIP
jgi:hypothetical protein